MFKWSSFVFIHYVWIIKWSSVFIQRITIPDILEDEWFKKDYKPPAFDEKEDANLDDVEAVFKDSEVFLASTWINLSLQIHMPKYIALKILYIFSNAGTSCN